MSLRAVSCAASSLLHGLLDCSARMPLPLREVARTRLSLHYETGRRDVPVLCVCTPGAVRLPGSVLAHDLPVGPLEARGGALTDGTTTWRVTRWWRPPRPRGLTAPPSVRAPAGVAVPDEVRPHDLVGRGPGLTPTGDDVLAGVLVAAHAVADPRLPGWAAATVDALSVRTTTAVSRGLLHHALDGWATPELADFVTAVCGGDATGDPTGRLLAVGHSSGAALAAGALHVLGTAPRSLEGAA